MEKRRDQIMYANYNNPIMLSGSPGSTCDKCIIKTGFFTE